MQADFTISMSQSYNRNSVEQRRKERLTLDHKKENCKQDWNAVFPMLCTSDYDR